MSPREREREGTGPCVAVEKRVHLQEVPAVGPQCSLVQGHHARARAAREVGDESKALIAIPNVLALNGWRRLAKLRTAHEQDCVPCAHRRGR